MITTTTLDDNSCSVGLRVSGNKGTPPASLVRKYPTVWVVHFRQLWDTDIDLETATSDNL